MGVSFLFCEFEIWLINFLYIRRELMYNILLLFSEIFNFIFGFIYYLF